MRRCGRSFPPAPHLATATRARRTKQPRAPRPRRDAAARCGGRLTLTSLANPWSQLCCPHHPWPSPPLTTSSTRNTRTLTHALASTHAHTAHTHAHTHTPHSPGGGVPGPDTALVRGAAGRGQHADAAQRARHAQGAHTHRPPPSGRGGAWGTRRGVGGALRAVVFERVRPRLLSPHLPRAPRPLFTSLKRIHFPLHLLNIRIPHPAPKTTRSSAPDCA
jgi:hypothetical protein